MARYENDPRWIEARFNGVCHKCGKAIKKGESIFYYPRYRRTYCESDICGGQASRDFDAACFDEGSF